METREPQAWERQPDESPVAYAAFQCYRSLGPERKFISVARQLDKNPSLILRWAKRHKWQERCYQEELNRNKESEVARREAQEEIFDRRRRFANYLERLAMGLFSDLFRRDPETGKILPPPKGLVREIILINRHAQELLDTLPTPIESTAADSLEERLNLQDDVTLRKFIEQLLSQDKPNTEETKNEDSKNDPSSP